MLTFDLEVCILKQPVACTVLNHGTMIRTGITCKSLVICATQLAGGLLLKKAKIF